MFPKIKFILKNVLFRHNDFREEIVSFVDHSNAVSNYFFHIFVIPACRSVEVAGQAFDRKVEGSSPDINIIGCRQEGHPDIKWLTAPPKSSAMQAPSNPQYGRKT